MKKLTPIHPGEILSAEFLEPKGISQSQAARAMSVPPRRINEICLGKRGITPDTALRLGRYFGVAAEFWMNLQQRHDLEVRRQPDRQGIESTNSSALDAGGLRANVIRRPLPHVVGNRG